MAMWVEIEEAFFDDETLNNFFFLFDSQENGRNVFKIPLKAFIVSLQLNYLYQIPQHSQIKSILPQPFHFSSFP
jgi:hypothetical protein